MTGTWNEAAPLRPHEWTLSMLQPLVDEGRIRVIDALANASDGDCRHYYAFFHHNDSGRATLMRCLLPQVREVLYGDTQQYAAEIR